MITERNNWRLNAGLSTCRWNECDHVSTCSDGKIKREREEIKWLPFTSLIVNDWRDKDLFNLQAISGGKLTLFKSENSVTSLYYTHTHTHTQGWHLSSQTLWLLYELLMFVCNYFHSNAPHDSFWIPHKLTNSSLGS